MRARAMRCRWCLLGGSGSSERLKFAMLSKGNPWLFSNREKSPERSGGIGPKEKMETLAEHIKLFDGLMGDVQHFAVMKKHFKAYISGWDGAKELRVRLMETDTAGQAIAILASMQY